MALREFTVYLSEELHRRLATERERTGLRKAEIVRAALRAAFNDEKYIPYRQPKPKDRQGRYSAARKYVKDLCEKNPVTMRPGKRWKRCPYLFRAAHGKYHCFEKKYYYPKCLHGCKAYYTRPPRKKMK